MPETIENSENLTEISDDAEQNTKNVRINDYYNLSGKYPYTRKF